MASSASGWESIVFAERTFVAVGPGGTHGVMTSRDGITWTNRSAAERNEWRSVTHGNGTFVAVAHDGTNRVMTSPDGVAWTARTAAEANAWRAVAFGDGLFVAVAANGTNRVMTSPDGVTWTARPGQHGQWTGLTYGDGQFVAVGTVGTEVMTSPDGITWTARPLNDPIFRHGVTYAEGQFVAVGGGGANPVMTSPDGIVWTPREVPEANLWKSVVYGNGTFVAVAYDGTDRVMTSPDGATWTTRSGTDQSWWTDVVFAHDLFVAVGATGPTRVMTSGTLTPWLPFDSWTAFVQQQFSDLLGRPPTTAELWTWVAALTSGEATKGSFVDALRSTTDNRNNVDATARLYRAFLGRAPDTGGLRFWIARRRSGAWSIYRMADHFAGSSEFKRTYGAISNRAFVTRIYTEVLGRDADPGGTAYWTGKLDARSKTRGQVMVGFSESNEYKRKQAENTDVAAAYVLLLGRSATALETADWVSRAQGGAPRTELLVDVLDGPEYGVRISG